MSKRYTVEADGSWFLVRDTQRPGEHVYSACKDLQQTVERVCSVLNVQHGQWLREQAAGDAGVQRVVDGKVATIQSLANDLGAAEREIGRLTAECEELRKDIAYVEQERDDARGELLARQGRVQELERELRVAREDVREFRSASERPQVLDVVTMLRTSLSVRRAVRELVEADLNALSNRLIDLARHVAALETEAAK